MNYTETHERSDTSFLIGVRCGGAWERERILELIKEFGNHQQVAGAILKEK